MISWRRTGWSTTSLIVIATLSALTGGAAQYVASRVGTSHEARPATAFAGQAKVGAPEGLQVVMAGDGASATKPSTTAGESAAAGADGAEGPAGLDGAAGADGADGVDGAAGADGENGADGETGPQGSVGATGPAGSAGTTGPAGPAGPGLTAVDHDGGGFEFRSPDGVSYRIHVTNNGIEFTGPDTTQVWRDTSHFQTLVP
jgi:hypothetical protein